MPKHLVEAKEGTLVVCSPSSNHLSTLYHYQSNFKNRITVERIQLEGDETFKMGRLFRSEFEELKTGNLCISAYRVETNYSTERLHQIIRLICTRTNWTQPTLRFLFIKHYGDKRVIKHLSRGSHWHSSEFSPINTTIQGTY